MTTEPDRPRARESSPVGLHRVVSPPGVLPQAAEILDADPAITDDEVRISVSRLNLDAASYRQLLDTFPGNPDALRASVAQIIRSRGKMHNPVTNSGGMLIGAVEAVGTRSPLGLSVGQRVATLVSLTLTPLRVFDDLREWDGAGEQVPCTGTAILFARSAVAVLPDDLDERLALAALDVCGAPALTARVVKRYVDAGDPPAVAVIGGGGKSGSMSLAAARRAGAERLVAVVPHEVEAARLRDTALADEVVIADARDPLALSNAIGQAVDVTVVCVDVPGCEGGAILATKEKGTVVFFSMATSFPAAALGAEGLAADITMLIGNGFVPGHAAYALDLLRTDAGVRRLFEQRISE